MIGAFIAGYRAAPAWTLWLVRWESVPWALPPLGEAWIWVDRQFAGNELPSAEVRLRGAIRGLLETTGDRYTILLDPQPARIEQQRLSGRYGDIGVWLWAGNQGEIFLSPYPTGPAAQANIRQGDRLLSLNGIDIEPGTGPDSIAHQLSGPVDTAVTLKLSRPPDLIYTVTITRAEVVHPSVRTRIVDQENRIALLQIAIFTNETANEVDQALTSLERTLGSDSRSWGLILDLRGNGGGVIAPLPKLVGYFLPAGSTIYYQRHREDEQVCKAEGIPRFQGPMVVLMDHGTASASEIVAAALRENDRAILIGKPTLGKGSVQTLHPLRDGSILHITSAVWLTPRRHRLEGAGLIPDRTVESAPGRDAPLEKAVQYLREMLP